MAHFTDDEIAYMEYLDELAPDLPCGSYGLLLRKGDPIAFELGLHEWLDGQKEED